MTIDEAYRQGLVVQVYDQVGCGHREYNCNDGCCYNEDGCGYQSPSYYVPAAQENNREIIDLCHEANNDHWPIA